MLRGCHQWPVRCAMLDAALDLLTFCHRCLASTEGDDEGALVGVDGDEETRALCGKCMRERGAPPN